MKGRYPNLMWLCLLLAISLVLSTPVLTQANQTKKDEKAKEMRLEGTVVLLSKDTSTVTILDRGRVRRPVLYDAKTQFTFRNKPGSIDMLKEGIRIICLGNVTEKKDFLATRIDIREKK